MVIQLNESDISYVISEVNNILSKFTNLDNNEDKNSDEVICVYHRDVYFPEGLLDRAKDFLKGLRSGVVKYSRHFFNNPFVNNSMSTGATRNHYYEPHVAKNILRRAIDLGVGDIFEICTNLSGEVVKIGIRTDYDDRDSIVFIIMRAGNGGLVKTVWLNRKNDKHRTLNSGKYVSGANDTKGYEYWSKLQL